MVYNPWSKKQIFTLLPLQPQKTTVPFGADLYKVTWNGMKNAPNDLYNILQKFIFVLAYKRKNQVILTH